AFDGPYAALIQSRAAAAGVTLVDSPAALVARVDIILGVTPGSSSIASATAFAPHLTKEKIYADVASATPKVKQEVEKILAGTGALLA
ncbi:NAD(P)-dependent oxidoreductase, partial [Escherichia coli]|nr:NAD(P)-dependent oxidoreductase [Escherichia coli]